MKQGRRIAAVDLVIAGLVGLAAASTSVQAQTPEVPWPNKVVRIIATSPPGGSIDALARILAEDFSKTFGQTFIVENRNGANGNVGGTAVVRAPADGYTLFVTIPGVFSINQFLYKDMPFDSEKDIAPVALLGTAPLILVVPSTAPPQTFSEFIAWVRANPGKFAYSSQGVGNTGHLGMELLKEMAKLDIIHVPYKGSAAALNDLLAGNVQMSLMNAPGALPYMQTGALRALGVAESRRIASAPTVPTIAESGVPGFEVTPWYGLGTRKGVAPDIIAKLNAAANAAMTRPDNVKRLTAAGIVSTPMTTPEFAAYIQTENKKWGEIIKRSGATASD